MTLMYYHQRVIKLLTIKGINLEVMNYSAPVNKEMELEELNNNLFSLPDHPDGYLMLLRITKRIGDFVLRIVKESDWKMASITRHRFKVC